jgi:hypothetical protein
LASLCGAANEGAGFKRPYHPRKMCFWILPDEVRGNASVSKNCFGTL